MRISEAARRLGTSARMLRYREDLGLLPHVRDPLPWPSPGRSRGAGSAPGRSHGPAQGRAPGRRRDRRRAGAPAVQRGGPRGGRRRARARAPLRHQPGVAGVRPAGAGRAAGPRRGRGSRPPPRPHPRHPGPRPGLREGARPAPAVPRLSRDLSCLSSTRVPQLITRCHALVKRPGDAMAVPCTWRLCEERAQRGTVACVHRHERADSARATAPSRCHSVRVMRLNVTSWRLASRRA